MTPDAAPPGGPKEPIVLCVGARARLASGQVIEAVELAKEAVAQAPEDPAVAGLVREIAMTLFRLSHWEDALPWLMRAAERAPDDAQVLGALRRAQRPAWLAPDVLDPRAGRRLQRHAPREGDSYIYVVEVVGTCNLRCPTCPVGNSGARALGFMEMELFDRIIAKIRRESPSPSPQVNLFNWGEPLLHPRLPEMIRKLKALGMRPFLSSNLNIKRGLYEAIAADPEDLKISISGFSPETYSRTHARGKLDLVKANMRAVREAIDASGAKTRVWVGHHIYKSNQHEAPALKALCDELGFAYSPMPAFYMPLERVLEHLDGQENPRDGGILADLLHTPAAVRAHAAVGRSGRYDCELRFNQTVINHDGTVALCCTVYDAENMLGVSFLDEDFQALEARKYRHATCDACFASSSNLAPPELDVIASRLNAVRAPPA